MNNYLKSIRIVYFALALGIILFLSVAVFIISTSGPFSGNELSGQQKAPFLIVLLLLTGGVFMVYKAILPKKLEVIKTLPELNNKMAAWRELTVLQAALIEAPAFFAIVLFLMLGIYTLLVWPVACMLILWMKQPTRDQLISDTALTEPEITEFDTMK